MSNQKTQNRLTLAALIDQKERILARKNQTCDLYIKSLGGTVTVQAPTPSLIEDVLEMKGGDGDKYMTFQSVIDPCLRDSQIMDAYGVSDPMELVEKLFMPGEIAKISTECMKLAGYDAGSVTPADQVEKVKN